MLSFSNCTLRSVLYVPANNTRAIKKILKSSNQLGADAIIFDLEDAIATREKNKARETLHQLLQNNPNHDQYITRINNLESQWCMDDLTIVQKINPKAIVLPKVDDAQDIEALTRKITELPCLKATQIWAMIETPKAILNIKNIAEQATKPSSRLKVIILGINDLAVATGVSITSGSSGRMAYLPWIMQCIAAARAYGLSIIDSVYNAYQDQTGFAQECAEAVSWGFDGKSLIHPDQIEICNRAFMPSQDAIDEAKAICTAFKKPQNSGRAVLNVNGKMVEELHFKHAEQLLSQVKKYKTKRNKL